MDGHTLRVDFDDGTCRHIAPRRTIAAVADGPDWSTIWHFDAQGTVEMTHINAEIKHVRYSLSLD